MTCYVTHRATLRAVQMVLGVSLALLLNRQFKGRSFVRGALMFPYLVPTVVAILLFRWMLNDLYGIVNVGHAASQDNQWWTHEIIVEGRKVTVLVDGKLSAVLPTGRV